MGRFLLIRSRSTFNKLTSALICLLARLYPLHMRSKSNHSSKNWSLFFALSQGGNRSCPPHLATFADSLFGKVIKGRRGTLRIANAVVFAWWLQTIPIWCDRGVIEWFCPNCRRNIWGSHAINTREIRTRSGSWH